MSPLIVALHIVICSQFNGLPLLCHDRTIATNEQNPFFTYTYCTQLGWGMVAKYVNDDLPNGYTVKKVRCTVTNKTLEIPS